MNFIQPPTDSIYKFKAVSGIALILFSLTVPVKFFHDVQLRKFEVMRHTGMGTNKGDMLLISKK